MNNKFNQTSVMESELEQRRERLSDYLKNFLENSRHETCRGLIWDVLGAEPHMACDQIVEMKETCIDLLVFLTDPEIAQKFKEKSNFYSRNFAKHLKRFIQLLDHANNEGVFAEIALYELENFGVDTENEIQKLESDFLK